MKMEKKKQAIVLPKEKLVSKVKVTILWVKYSWTNKANGWMENIWYAILGGEQTLTIVGFQ